MRNARASKVARILIAAAAAAALGGCFHVPLRARYNGRELGYQAESSIIYGPRNATSTRQIQSALQSSAMGWQAAKPFQPFGQWVW